MKGKPARGGIGGGAGAGGSGSPLHRPLRVARLIATRSGDLDRGPMVMMNSSEASIRLLLDGELAWVHSPRRHELAVVKIDDTVPRGDAVLRDVAGASPSEIVRVIKPDFDAPRPPGHFA